MKAILPPPILLRNAYWCPTFFCYTFSRQWQVTTCIVWSISKQAPRLRLGAHKGIEWNEMYLSKRKKWNGMELSNFDWMF